jgi:hypothetical protein
MNQECILERVVIPVNNGVLVRPKALLAVIPFKGELLWAYNARWCVGVPETEGVPARKRGRGAWGMDCSTVPVSSSISTSDVGKSKAGGEDMVIAVCGIASEKDA